MKKQTLTLISRRSLNDEVFGLTFAGAEPMRPGQFVELSVDGGYLRRPISVADSRGDELTLIVKKVGKGTREMAEWQPGKKVSALTSLGNGFGTDASRPLLIGGGIGCAPLYMLARTFAERGVRPTVVLAFGSADQIYFEREFGEFGNVIVATDDGSRGIRGNAASAVRAQGLSEGKGFDRYYACGPLPMLRALAAWSGAGELSLEARMGCGFGACMGCSVKTADGYARVCKEGPVFPAASLIWE